MKKHILIPLFLLMTMPCFAQNEANYSEQYYYDFHPLTALALGRTFDPNHLDDGKISPIKFTEKIVDINNEKGSLMSSFDVYLVQNQEQLNWAFNYDSKYSARYFKVKASGSFSILNNFEFKKNSAYLVINARSEFSRTAIDNIELTDLAKQYQSKPAEFKKNFGTRIVTMVRKGISVWILVSIDNVSYDLLNRIQYSANASGKFGPLSGSAEINVKNELNYMKNSKELNIKIISSGGSVSNGEYEKILNSIKSASMNNFNEIKEAITEAIFNPNSYNINNAVPIGFFTTSIAALVSGAASDVPINPTYEKTLLRLVNLYNKIEHRILKMNNIKSGNDPLSQVISEDSKNNLNDYISTLEKIKDKVEELHAKTIILYDKLNNSSIQNIGDAHCNKPICKIITKIDYIEKTYKQYHKNDFPNVAPLLLIRHDSTKGGYQVRCFKMEELRFRIYYFRGENETKITQHNIFSNLVFEDKVHESKEVVEIKVSTGNKSEVSTQFIFGKFSECFLSKDIISMALTNLPTDEVNKLREELKTSKPTERIDFNLFLKLKSPFIGEVEILIGKVYFHTESDRVTKSKPAYVLLYDKIVVPEIGFP